MTDNSTTDLRLELDALFGDQKPDYAEPKFRILEEDGHSHKDGEHDPLEVCQASSSGHFFMHVSCREKVDSWTADHHGGPIPSFDVLDAAWREKHPA
jgi:hypothetical protein